MSERHAHRARPGRPPRKNAAAHTPKAPFAARLERVDTLTLLADGLVLTGLLIGLCAAFLALYGGASYYGSGALGPLAARPEKLLVFSGLFALLSLAVWRLPRLRGAAVCLAAALIAAAAFVGRQSAARGFALVCFVLRDAFFRWLHKEWRVPYTAAPLPRFFRAADSVQFFLLLALAALALALGGAVTHRLRWSALLVTFLPLLPGLLLGLVPNRFLLLPPAACWCAMLLSDLCGQNGAPARARCTLLALPAAAALLAVLFLALPSEGYTRPAWARAASARLSAEFKSLTGRADKPNPAAPPAARAKARSADLAHAGPLRFSGRTALRMTADAAQSRLYLRGASLGVYENGVWSELSQDVWQAYSDAGHSAAAPALSLALPADSAVAVSGSSPALHTAAIENVAADQTILYTPYFLIEQDWAALGAQPVGDSFFSYDQGGNPYTVSYASLPNADISPPVDDAYRDFVYENYRGVPEDIRAALQAVPEIRALTAEEGLTARDAAARVGALLEELCEYDVNAGAAPAGSDPVLYFLTESHRGYCMHFASAAALILRAMGFPARYVSGYVADCAARETADVPDRAAHAWVELWRDGFGWYPAEVTPPAALEWYRTGVPPEEAPGAASESASASEPEPEPPVPSGVPDAPSASDASPVPNVSSGGAPVSPKASLAALRGIGRFFAVLAGIAAFLGALSYLPKRVRDRRMADQNHKKAALACYGYLCRMRRWGGAVDERALALAQKARFGPNGVTADELRAMRGMVNDERRRLAASPSFPRRMAFRFVWGRPNAKH